MVFEKIISLSQTLATHFYDRHTRAVEYILQKDAVNTVKAAAHAVSIQLALMLSP